MSSDFSDRSASTHAQPPKPDSKLAYLYEARQKEMQLWIPAIVAITFVSITVHQIVNQIVNMSATTQDVDDPVLEKHQDFLHCMRQLYETLTLMGYIDAENISWNDKPDLRLYSQGYSREVILLIAAMPYPKASYLNSLSDPLYPPQLSIVPRSGPVCFDDEDTEGGSGREIFIDNGVLPPSALKITYWGDDGSEIYIYDLEEKVIIIWEGHDEDAAKTYHEQPRRPAAMVINEWISKLDGLEWIPWIVDGWHTVQEISGYADLPGMLADHMQFMASINMMPDPNYDSRIRGSVNWFNSMRVIYERCGWPDRSLFDRGKFLQMRDEWHEGQLKVLQDMWHANPDSAGGAEPHPPHMELSLRYMGDDADPLREYLRQTAGPYAV